MRILSTTRRNDKAKIQMKGQRDRKRKVQRIGETEEYLGNFKDY